MSINCNYRVSVEDLPSVLKENCPYTLYIYSTKECNEDALPNEVICLNFNKRNYFYKKSYFYKMNIIGSESFELTVPQTVFPRIIFVEEH